MNTTVICPKCSTPSLGGETCPRCIGRSLFGGDKKAESRVVDGYRIAGEIGRGAMGVVFRAEHIELRREVALKFIHAGAAADAVERERFSAEAAMAARLDHPNIVPIHEVGESDGACFFSMKLVEGGTLAERRGEFHPPRDGGRRIAELMEKIARAVQHAHERGVLHRDLKPGNILLDEAGEPMVADFGLARRIEHAPGTLTLGSALGTPAYMAPEQARGGGTATTTADIYSLGAILYELLAGRPPFAAESSSATLALVLADEPPPALRTRAPATHRDLATICGHCIERDPARRYVSAAALAEDLARWRRGEPIHARPVRWPERVAKWARRRPALAAVSTIALLLACVGVVFWQSARSAASAAAAAGEREQAVGKIAAELRNTQRELGAVIRGAGGIGQRFRALDVLEKLARSGGITPELRGEAIASLCLPDLRQLSDVAPQITTGNVGIHAASGNVVFGWSWGELNGQLHFPGSAGKRILRDDGSGTVGWLQFSPDGLWLAARGGSGAAWWRYKDGALIARVPCAPGSGASRGVSFAADGKRLAHPDGAGKVTLRSVETGAVLAEITPASPPADVRWALRDDRIAIATQGGLEIWKAPAGATPERIAQAAQPGIAWVSWDGAGNRLATLAGDRGITIWEAATLTHRAMSAPWDSVLLHYVEFHPAGRHIITSSDIGETRVWDILLDRQVLRADGVRLLSISGDGARIGAQLRPYSGPAAVLEFSPAAEFRAIPLGTSKTSPLDVKDSILFHKGKTARAFDLAQSREVPAAFPAAPGVTPQPRATSPGGALEAALDGPARIALRANGGALLAHFTAPAPEPLAGVCFSSDARWLIGVTEKGVIQLWDIPRIRDGLRAIGLDW